MKLSVVIPMHNEEGNVEALLASLTETLSRLGLPYEIIPVDDHSSDSTGPILDRWAAADTRVRVIHRRDGKRGVGFNYRQAFSRATGDTIVTMDGDLSHDPHNLPALIDGLSRGDFVIGSRFIEGGSAELPASRILLTLAFNLLVRRLFFINARDLTSGYRAFRHGLLDGVTLEGERFDAYPELAIVSSLRGARLVEVPMRYVRRKAGTSKLHYAEMSPRYARLLVRLLFRMKRYRALRRHTS